MAAQGSAIIGALRVVLGADTAAFSGGLKKAEADIAAFQKRATQMGKTIGVALGSAVVAFAALTKSSAKFASDIDDASQRLGVGAEAFQELSYAAKLAGVSQEELEKSLGQMNKRLGEVKAGNTAAGDSLAKLGLKLDDIKKLKPDEAFKVIADALSRVKNPMEQAALAAEFFGKAGVKLLPVLSQGKAGLEAMGAEARKLGLILSNETIKQAAAADDEFDKIGLSLKVAGVNLTAGFLPALEKIREVVTSQAFQQGVKDFGTNMGAAVKFLVDNKDAVRDVAFTFAGMVAGGRIAGGFGMIAGAAAGMTYSTLTAGESVKTLNGQIAVLENELKTFEAMQRGDIVGRAVIREPQVLADNIEEVKAKLDALRAARDKFAAGGAPTSITVRKQPDIDPQAGNDARLIAEEIKNLQFQTQLANGEFRNFADGFPQAAAKLKLFGQTGIELRTTIDSLPPGLRAINDQMLILKAAQLTQENLAPWQKYQLEIEKVNQLMDKGLITTQTYAKATQAAAEKFGQSWETVTANAIGGFAAFANEVGKSNSKIATIGKALAIVEATINTYVAFTKALASFAPPFNYIAAAGVLAAGMAKVIAIKGQTVPKMATGGAMRLNGMGAGPDSQLLQARIRPDEQVDIWRPGEGGDPRRGAGSLGATIVLQGESFSRAHIERLVDGINDLMGDRGGIKLASV